MKTKMLFVCAAIATYVFAAGGQYAFAGNGHSDGPELDDPPIGVDAVAKDNSIKDQNYV